jgi:hypothetical protein
MAGTKKDDLAWSMISRSAKPRLARIQLDPLDPAKPVGYKGLGNRMRKRLKKKRRSCALCKPHKMGKAVRWKAAEFDRLATDEKEIKRILRAAG